MLQLLKAASEIPNMSGVAPLTAVCERVVCEAVTLRFIPMRENISTPATPASLTTHKPIDFGSPVGCGGVAVIPKDLADEVARDGFEQEGIEVFIKLQEKKGRFTIGFYPPDDEGRAEYADWLAADKPC